MARQIVDGEEIDVKLLPCPFCGGEAEDRNDTGPSDDYFSSWYECKDCGARANDVASWNRRRPAFTREEDGHLPEALRRSASVLMDESTRVQDNEGDDVVRGLVHDCVALERLAARIEAQLPPEDQ